MLNRVQLCLLTNFDHLFTIINTATLSDGCLTCVELVSKNVALIWDTIVIAGTSCFIDGGTVFNWQELADILCQIYGFPLHRTFNYYHLITDHNCSKFKCIVLHILRAPFCISGVTGPARRQKIIAPRCEFVTLWYLVGIEVPLWRALKQTKINTNIQ